MPNEIDEAIDRIGGSAAAVAPTPANPIDSAIDRIAGTNETLLRKSIADAADFTPEQAAEARRISLKVGVPVDVVQRNLKDYQKQGALAQPYQQMQDESPALTTWLQKPENVAVAKDDLEQLGLLEWLIKAPQRAFASTINQQRYSELRFKEVLGQTLTLDEHDLMESYRYQADADGAASQGTSWFRKAVVGTASFMANQQPIAAYGIQGATYGAAAGLGASLAAGPGAPILGAVTAPAAAIAGGSMGVLYGVLKSTFQQETAGAYDEYVKQPDELGRPIDPAVARAAALAVGAINAPIEAGAQEFLLKSIPGINKLASMGVRDAVAVALKSPTVRAALFDAVKSYTTTLAAETGQEVAQRAVTILVGELLKSTNRTVPVPGQIAPGNVDLYQQPTVPNKDGSVSTVDSLSVNIDGKEVLLPTVTADGRHFEGSMKERTDQALEEYHRTGRNLGTFASPEAANAFAEQLHQDYAAGVYAAPYRKTQSIAGIQSIASDLLQEGVGALTSFALGVLPGPFLEGMHNVRQARQAQANVQLFTALGEGALASKTLQRSPEAVQAFIAEVKKDGPIKDVFIDKATWSTYWQDKGMDPAQLAAEVTGSRDAYEQLGEQGRLAIPIERYATKLAGTEHNAFLSQELRLHEDEMNGREATAYLAGHAARTAELAAHETEPSSPNPIRQNIVSQLEQAGVPTTTAESYATLYESAFGSLAERAGVSPEALYARYGLTIRREGESASQAGAVQPGATGPAEQATFEALTAPLTAEEVQALERRRAAGVSPTGLERREPRTFTDPALAAIYHAAMADMSSPAADQVAQLAADPTLLTRAADARRQALAAPLTPGTARFAFYEGFDEAPEPKYYVPTETGGVTPVTADRLRELGIEVPHTPPDTGVRLSGTQQQQAAVDARAAMAQTTADVTGTAGARAQSHQARRAAVSGPSESTPPKRAESAKQFAARRTAHYNEVFDAILSHAEQVDPNVDDAALRQEFNDRVDFLEAGDEAYLESGHNPRELLEAIAKAGGLSLAAETGTTHRLSGYSGELKWLRESPALGPFGSYGGVRGVFQTRTTGSTGAFTGLSVDDVLTSLRQDPRFAYLETHNDLFKALEDVARLGDVGYKGVTLPGTEELQRRAGMNPRVAWWKPTEYGQDLFGKTPEELAAEAAQPVLPGTEQVRKTENPTPQLEAPFSLTSEVSQRKGKQTTLFQGAYHGSPHSFERFSLQAIGTGEGAQAYGWGLYFAGKREVADFYRDALQGRVAYGETRASDAHMAAVQDLLKNNYSHEAMLEALRSAYPHATDEEFERAIKQGRPGRVYTVEIPDDPDFLDYDNVASKQSPKVQAALTALGIKWEPLQVPTPKQAIRTFESLRIQRLAAADIGTRQVLREGLRLAQQANLDEVAPSGATAEELFKSGRFASGAFRVWWGKNQGLMRENGFTDPTGERIYSDLQMKWQQENRHSSLRESAKAASLQLNLQGIAGIRYLDGQSRSTGAGNSNYVVFDENLVKITEYDQAIKLAAVHQLSAENLRHADTLGGLAVPSIAVLPSSHGTLRGYGEITLIGRSELADPTKQPIFDADAYTSRFPPAEYGKAKQAVAQALVNKFRAVSVEFDDRSLTDQIWDNAINRPNPRDTISSMQRSLAAQALFLREQGLEIQPVHDAASLEAPFVAMPAFQKFAAEHGGTISYGTQSENTDYEKQLGQAIATAIDEYAASQAGADADLRAHLREIYHENYLEENGKPVFGRQIRLDRSLKAVGRQDVQYGPTREAIAPLLAGKEAAFTTWIERQVMPMYPDPKVTVGRRKMPYTLQNIVERMLEGPTKGSEKTMTFGEGMARAASATQFTDLTWLRNAAEWMIQPEGDINAAREHAKKLLEDWRGEVIGHYTGLDWKHNIDTWNALDASMRAIARWSTTRKGSDERRLSAALLREGFRGVPADVIERGVAAGKAFKEAPVPYFESKPQRAVKLGEFAGAVIPESASEQTRNILDRNGVPYVTYPPDDLAARDAALVTFREELQTRGEDVLFQERRGSIRFGPDRQMNISLFAKADLSTFLHETGHFFLEIQNDLVDELATRDPTTLTPSQRQLVNDRSTTFEFLGVTKRADIGAAEHEKFARAFEAYLMKGEAPSIALRGAFARFRAWLTGIYRALKNLKVTLSPEITHVMDRLVATDAAITDAEGQRAVSPLFIDAAAAGMSERQFGLYRAQIADASREAQEMLQTKLLVDVTREKTAEWERRRAEIHAAVTTEMQQRPEFIALAAIQRGTFTNGDSLQPGEDPKPMKLSRQAIVDEFGKDRLRTLPRPYVYTNDGTGLTPRQAAEVFGYSSGDELLTALSKAGKMSLAIETETDRRMIAEAGSILLDGSLAEHAKAAVANEGRDAVVRTELKALLQLKRLVAPHLAAQATQNARERTYERRWLEAEAKLRIAIAEGRKQAEIDGLQDEVDNLKRKASGGPAVIAQAIPSAQTIKTAAEARVASMRVRDIKPERFWSTAQQAQKAAVAAAARQDFDAAIAAQQQQLFHLALFREAERALDDTDARVRAAKQLGTPAARARLGKAGGSFLEQVDNILARYEFAAITGKALGKRAELRRWMAAMEGEGFSIELPDEVLDEARRQNYSELTYDELVGVTDGLTQIVHLARTTLRRLQSAAEEDYAATRDGLVDGANAHGVKREAKLELLPKDRRTRVIGEWIASHTKLAQFIAALDGYIDGGPWWEAIMRPVNEAATKQQAMHETAAIALKKLIVDAYTGKELAHFHDLLFIPALGKSLTKEARLAVALNWGNEGNRQRLTEHSTRKWNAQQVQAILDTLDRRDLAFVQGTLDYINSYWPAIEAKQKRVFGIAPEKVPAATWTHSIYGEQQGGYYPIAYDGRLLVSQGNIIDADQASLQKHANYAYATTKRGYTKAREERVNAPIRLELSVAGDHLEAVIHDLTHHEMLIDVGRLLGDRKVQQAIQSRAGDIVYRQMRGALLDIALGARHTDGALGRAINYIRGGATIAGIGWNLHTGLLHLSGVFNGMARVGPTWVMRGMVHVFRDASSMEYSARWVGEKSEMMRLRAQTFDRDVGDVMVSLRKTGGWFDNLLRTVTADKVQQEDIIKSYGAFISTGVHLASLPIWIGEYEKATAAHGTHEDDARAVALADQAVLDTMGGGQIKDLAQVQRGGPLAKLFTTFYTYGGLIFNQTTRAVGETNFRKVGSVGQMLVNLGLIYVAPAVFAVGLGKAFGGEPEDWLPLIGRELLGMALNTMVLFREAGGAARALYSKEFALQGGGDAGYGGPTGLRLIDALGRLGVQIQQGKFDRAAVRSLEDVVGVLFHLPLAQVQRSIDGFVALEEGRTRNPAALLMGAPPKK